MTWKTGHGILRCHMSITIFSKSSQIKHTHTHRHTHRHAHTHCLRRVPFCWKHIDTQTHRQQTHNHRHIDTHIHARTHTHIVCAVSYSVEVSCERLTYIDHLSEFKANSQTHDFVTYSWIFPSILDVGQTEKFCWMKAFEDWIFRIDYYYCCAP